ncbi:AAA family ATPase [Aureimonas mangrovi]|uniref:AAA family ATPase n=1 Tax=Aureimonas mangrovi TaxID=2758041 RepID=UPI00163DCD00|nr:AAA family ATPase [Aureimonas mangrovi]
MLRKLKVTRFKSIYEHEFDFGRINLLVGSNGSGKSNLLEALGVLSAALSSGLDSVTLDLKGVRLSLPHIFKSAFKGYDLPKTFRLSAEFDHGRYECSISSSPSRTNLEFTTEALYCGDKQIFGRGPHGVKLHSVANQLPSFRKDSISKTRSVWSVLRPLVEIPEEFRLELDHFAGYAIYAPQTAVMRGLAIDSRVVEPLGLTGSGLASAFSTCLDYKRSEVQKLINIIWEPGWADRVQTGEFDANIVPGQVRSEGVLLYIRDKYMKSGRNMLSAFDASEGTLYLIFVATLLAHRETPNSFALDNVDGTLNPRLVRTLAKHLIDVVGDPDTPTKRQSFMTSHHPSSLDSFDIFENDQKIFICHRSTDGDQGALGRSLFRTLQPPENTDKAQWIQRHQGKKLSELLLTERIRDAL